MNLFPGWYGPVDEVDELQDFHTVGGVVAGSITERHRGILRQLALDSIVSMKAQDDGTPAGAAVLVGIIDAIDDLDRLAVELERRG